MALGSKKKTGKFSSISLKKKLLIAMFILAFLALFVTSLIKYEEKTSNAALNNVCTATSSNCQAVQESEYGKIFGLKIVDFGLIAFPLLLFLLIWQFVWPMKGIEMLVRIGGAMAGIFAAYFISLQIFTLHQYCIFCLVVDSCGILLAVLAVYYTWKFR
jgi:uncharacterized membrane protein